MAERPLLPPPGVPVRSFNDPPHLEADWVERVDITAAGYERLEVGTLYSSLQGAQQRIVDAYPALFLLHEIVTPASYPWAFRYWATAYVELEGQVFDSQINTIVPIVDRYAEAGTEIGSPGKEIDKINRQIQLIREYNVDLLEPVITYGYVQYQLPRELIDVDLVGSQQKQLIPTFRDPPEGVFKARFTREYSATPFGEPDEPTLLWPQSFHGFVEVTEITSSSTEGTSESTSHNTSDSSSHNTSDHQSEQTGTHEGTDEGSGTSESTHESHSESVSSGSDTATTSNSGAPLVGGPQNNRVWGSEQVSDTSGYSSGTHGSTGSNSGTSGSTSEGTSSSDTTSDTISDTTSDGTHESESTTTRLALIPISIPPTLHAQIIVGSMTIPATTPTGLPWGDWLTIRITTDIGRFAFIRDTLEIKLPELPP